MAFRSRRTISPSYPPNNHTQTTIAKPLCVLLLVLIACNLITLHFLMKSVKRTSSMNCPMDNTNTWSHDHPAGSHRQNFPNLLGADSPYSHLPYLPHNLQDYAGINPHNLNDANFIAKVKQYNAGNYQQERSHSDGQEFEDNSESEERDESDEEEGGIYTKYKISRQLNQPEQSLTIQDEINRNHIITNEQLWNLPVLSDTDSDNFEEADLSDIAVDCDNSMEYLFNASIHILHKLKARNYMESAVCPNIAKLGWRKASYVPFIFGNHCEPWWARDVVFIMSRLVNKDMIGIEWGTGVSSLWLSMLSNYTIAMEHDKEWQNGVNEIRNKLGIDNLAVLNERLGRKYCEPDYSESFDPLKVRNSARWKKGSIDFVSIDGRLRYPVTEWVLEWIKPNGGVVVFDNSDSTDDDRHMAANATNLMPKYWLRYDSSYFKQHTEVLSDQRWLRNSQTSIWITRHPKCARVNNFGLKGPNIVARDYDNVFHGGDEQDGVRQNDEDSEPVLNFKPF